MPGNKKHDLVPITVRIRGDQKEKIDKTRKGNWGVTQDSIVRDALDEHFKGKESK